MTHYGQPIDFQTRALPHRQIQKRLSHSRLKVTCRSLVVHCFTVFEAMLVLGLVGRIYVRWYGNLQLSNHHRLGVQPSTFAFELLDHHHD
jgi:hypothetical protein